MMRGMSFRPVAAGVAIAAGLLAVVPLADARASAQKAAVDPPPVQGSAGLGDRLYPKLGNGGYDVQHYDLSVRYATTKPSQSVAGTVVITALATQSLSRFDLDFSGRSVGTVWVNGQKAAFARAGQELRITPAAPIVQGSVFTVRVTYVAVPTKPAKSDASFGFFITKEGSVLAGQPDASHYYYPSNDHPSDKASYTFHLNVPKGETAVANGDLVTRDDISPTRTVWTYRQDQPMAPELTQVAVGKYSVIHRPPVGAVTVRDVVPTAKRAFYKDLFAGEGDQIAWMQKRVGAYPFTTYGSLVVTAKVPFSLETQTLSLFPADLFEEKGGGYSIPSEWGPVALHELAHQWFGDSVAPKSWSDIWLNEGHATWYEFTYAFANHYTASPETFRKPTLTALMKYLYKGSDQMRADNGPVAQPTTDDDVFGDDVYYGGALALYALRQKIGVAAFDKLEQTWVSTYRDRSASTADFIALAGQVSGQNLTSFLNSWLYSTTTPPMPGHSAWKSAPVKKQKSTPATAR